MSGAAIASRRTILDYVGQTPLVELAPETGFGVRILAKVEFYSPSGGPKDRVVLRIIERAEREGLLRPGMTLIEASTGSTGIATALAGAVKGYDVVIVMPEGMSRERRWIIRALGARLELTPGGGSDIEHALRRVRELMEAEPGRYFFINQFANPENVWAHYYGTAREIWEQTGGEVDAFVAAMGTGGTITGVARFLKERRPDVRCFVVEPAACATFLTGQKGPHAIEGVGDGIVPPIFDPELVDGVVLVTDEEAIAICHRLARREGLLVGPSSGANVAAAVKVGRAFPELERIVTLLPDSGLRYLSTGMWEKDPGVRFPLRPEVVEWPRPRVRVVR